MRRDPPLPPPRRSQPHQGTFSEPLCAVAARGQEPSTGCSDQGNAARGLGSLQGVFRAILN